MANIERSIELEVPVTTAYEAWTRFEDFPGLTEEVQGAERLPSGHMRFSGDLGFGPESWEMRILEAIPDLLVSWESTSRRRSAGTATFDAHQGHTRLKLTVSYDPEGVPASEGRDHRQVMAARLDRHLRQFKRRLEQGAAAPAQPPA